jgi:alpha-methylacyl-CoA racemase
MNGLFPGMQTGQWSPERGTNMLDGGAHFYGSYETKDGRYVSIGSIEPQFYALLLEKTGLANDPALARQMSRSDWPALQEKLTAVFKTRTRDEWDAIMLGSDVCYAPILSFAEAVEHPHNRARQTFVEVDGLTQAAPAPRFSRTAPEVPAGAAAPGQHSNAVLQAAGFSQAEIEQLVASGAVA